MRKFNLLPALALLLGSSSCAEPPPRRAGVSLLDTIPVPFAVAESLRLEGRSAQAAPLFRALRDSFALAADTPRQWRAQLWWADALMRVGRRDSARAALVDALVLAGADPVREGWTRQVMSLLLHREARFDSALAQAQRATELGRSNGDARLEAAAWSAQNTIHSLSGRYRLSLAASESALAVYRATNAGPRAIANMLNELGINYRHMGRFTDAIRVFEEGLAMYRELRSSEGQARVSYNLANVHASMGETDRAVALMQESLSHAEQIRDVRGLGFIHNGLTEQYTLVGNRAAARSHAQQALTVNRESGVVVGQVIALTNLGQLALHEGDLATARRTLTEALGMADASNLTANRTNVRLSLAEAHRRSGDLRNALRVVGEAIALADTLDDPELRHDALIQHASTLESARDPRATDVYLAAIELLESWRGRLALGDLRMGVTRLRLAGYEGAVRTMLAAERHVEAFEIAERARARLLLDLMAERDASIPAGSRAEVLRRDLAALFEEQQSALPEALGGLGDRIDQLQAELEALERETRSVRPVVAAARFPAPATAQAVIDGLARPGRGLLAFFWGDQHVYGWILTVNGLRGARLGATDSLTTLVAFLRSGIENRDGPDWRLPARRAFQTLVAPLQPAQAEEWLIIADGPLAAVPFEALVPDDGDLPWAAHARIAYGPSASVLLSLATAPPAQPWQRTVLAVGDPAMTEEAASEIAEFRGSALGPLPYAAQEARDIRSLFRSDGADVLIGDRATLDRWLDRRPGRYRYLHFAAHAQVSDRRPALTRIVLADEPLDLAAIRRLDLSAELVTLSACETALGSHVRGEGIIGLPHAFLAAGARGTVVSLWRVADRATAAFMADFYAALRAGASPAQALFETRRRRITASGDESHPSHWAAFILVGGNAAAQSALRN